ncbi:DNA polymerase lambda [Colletotrichum shisoi]|uniref:DNA polymerase n=1 Tax=Colletotrichum shisoi TaxID=2078593 RepID=A0A5Q4C9A3_9PEZI|nr:DNA polymerase lambda [Colletotrichum shisoi]
MALELPPVYLLPTHLKPDELHDLEGKIPSLTYNIQEASIVIGKISQRERALFELRRGKVLTDPIDATRISESPSATPRKRKRALSGSGSESTLYSEDEEKYGPVPIQTIKALANKSGNTNVVKVVKLAWLTDSLAQGEILPLRNYLLYEGRKKGWRDLDDVVEHGWHTLGRVQQIGVKYYDEFKLKIPRTEVESIADAILVHARNINPGFELVIVGGYRRGKQGSGDVDVVISHRDESATMHFVDKLVVSLEKSRHITHTLTLSNHNSERGQRPVSWKDNESRGSGFDTLDKALVVWQELEIESHKGYPKETKEKPHRRVDIIISPWKTVGCAVLGWSGDTTFQRDLRRYCKKQKSFKFDSSGIRSRVDGSWIDLEGGKLGKAPDMLTAEKRVFEGLGLEWVRPEDRCTG